MKKIKTVSVTPSANHLHTIVMIIAWTLIFSLPILLGKFPLTDYHPIVHILQEYCIILGLFIINRCFFKRFLTVEKWKTYLILIVVGMFITFGLIILIENAQPFPGLSMSDRPSMPIEGIREAGHRFRPDGGGPMVPAIAHISLLTILIIGLDDLLFVSLRWMTAEQERTRLAKDNVQMQLAFLQQQVSPHLFMNTLNNIHALIEIDSEKAQTAVIQLSQLMSYLIYDSNKQEIKLVDELNFIDNYIALMRLRFPSRVSIRWNRPDNTPSTISIPPLLYISAIENAFKHGVSYKKASFIDINLQLVPSVTKAEELVLDITNSDYSKQVNALPDVDRSSNEKHGGLGMRNMKDRLDILY
ncbi:MAG: histidine kinase, partial [Bacteroidaceae bacterium]